VGVGLEVGVRDAMGGRQAVAVRVVRALALAMVAAPLVVALMAAAHVVVVAMPRPNCLREQCKIKSKYFLLF